MMLLVRWNTIRLFVLILTCKFFIVLCSNESYVYVRSLIIMDQCIYTSAQFIYSGRIFNTLLGITEQPFDAVVSELSFHTLHNYALQ